MHREWHMLRGVFVTWEAYHLKQEMSIAFLLMSDFSNKLERITNASY